MRRKTLSRRKIVDQRMAELRSVVTFYNTKTDDTIQATYGEYEETDAGLYAWVEYMQNHPRAQLISLSVRTVSAS